MLVVMGRTPISSTHVTELESASASHVIAALIFLYDELTIFALSVVQVIFKELKLYIFAWALMNGHETF